MGLSSPGPLLPPRRSLVAAEECSSEVDRRLVGNTGPESTDQERTTSSELPADVGRGGSFGGPVLRSKGT